MSCLTQVTYFTIMHVSPPVLRAHSRASAESNARGRPGDATAYVLCKHACTCVPGTAYGPQTHRIGPRGRLGFLSAFGCKGSGTCLAVVRGAWSTLTSPHGPPGFNPSDASEGQTCRLRPASRRPRRRYRIAFNNYDSIRTRFNANNSCKTDQLSLLCPTP